MPRKSAASLIALPMDASQRRIKAPETLPPAVRTIWASIVNTLPASHFHKSDASLLALYCRSVHQAGLAYDNIEKHGAFDGSSQNPAVRVADANTKLAATLAQRLRLCPSARLDRTVAGKNARHDESAPRPWRDDDDGPPDAARD